MTTTRRLRQVTAAVAAIGLLAAACGTDSGSAEPDAPARPEPPPATEPAGRPDEEPMGPAEDPGDPEPPATEPPATEPPATEPTPVPAVLDFTAARVGGGEVVGADFAGQGVVLWFWAPW